ncbi:MAG TPA: geranyl transferase [Gammaproteobacteria bacterium]|nr:geranyl transferase [Gammaproteobacteria bacterium]HAT27367.1 geranyl transferase [Gammaproteobacteria bacterium]
MSSQPSPSLETFISQCQQRVNQTLTSKLAFPQASAQLLAAMQYAGLGAGKRIRPVLVYGSNQAVGGDLVAADIAACAVELIHSYSLVHDDLPSMDNDDLRRGKPTTHKAFDEATAILAGDALQSLAFQLLSNGQQALDAETLLTMISLLSEASGAQGMVAGQSLDFEAVGKQLSLAQLETMHNLKTGALIRASVLLGGLSHGDTSASQQDALGQYAQAIGLAFQVQDDILDVIGDSATLGKPQGSDQLRNKPTYVSLLGLEAARTRATQLANNAVAALGDFSGSADRLRELATYIIRRLH